MYPRVDFHVLRSGIWCVAALMNTRRRHTPRSNQDGVYTGPTQTQTQTQLVQPLETPLSVPFPLAPPVDPISMSGRDRTTEFQSVCKSLQGRQVSRITVRSTVLYIAVFWNNGTQLY